MGYFFPVSGLGPAIQEKITVFGQDGPGLCPGPEWPKIRIFGQARCQFGLLYGRSCWTRLLLILLLRPPGSARRLFREGLGARLGPGMSVGLM